MKNKIIKGVLEVIESNWKELTFDLHTRFCKITDEKAHRMCDEFKEGVKKNLKEKIKKEAKKWIKKKKRLMTFCLH